MDPFPSIPPALLNSADLLDYVAATGMIFPFHDQRDRLKPASYEVALLGPIVWYDASGARHYVDLADGDEFTLEANSIAFVSLEPEFRIPTYLAVRFNLRITQIYRGLLLGTGPLVDPGFTGRLSLPLHNWTDNDYVLIGGDGLIWIEVTKLSPAERSKSRADKVERRGSIAYLEENKQNLTLLEYLRKADPHRPIRSSIPNSIERATKAAEKSARLVRDVSIGAAAGLALALAAIVVSVFMLINQADNATNATRSELAHNRLKLRGSSGVPQTIS